MTQSQPIPNVTQEDVERIVRRDFPADEYESVSTMLEEVGGGSEGAERSRLQLAVLKLSEGRQATLRMEVQSAKFDFRDAIAAAEYPEYKKLGSRVDSLSTEERNRIVVEDWNQYQEWLYRGDSSKDAKRKEPPEKNSTQGNKGPGLGEGFVVGGCGCLGAFLALGVFGSMVGGRFHIDIGGMVLLFACGGVIGSIIVAVYNKGRRDASGG
ncbi:MAG: hypothetical protein KC994_05810 [Candidatus Omnitrophica bacterium]|nr:hypothetical protein [Candidatus Omnitrophota bacterium]MCA9437570.1 hypothetical protein [Candidatus Omnitrophota bacterium]